MHDPVKMLNDIVLYNGRLSKFLLNECLKGNREMPTVLLPRAGFYRVVYCIDRGLDLLITEDLEAPFHPVKRS